MIIRSSEAFKMVLLMLLIFINIQQCYGIYKQFGRSKAFESFKFIHSTTKSPWIEEPEDDTLDSVFPPVPTPRNSMDTSMMNQILEAVSSNGDYLKKIINFEHHTHDVGKGLREIKETVFKHFEEINEQLRVQNTQEKEVIKELNNLISQISHIRNDFNEIKSVPERKSGTLQTSFVPDTKCESKMTNVEEILKTLTEAVEQVVTNINDMKSRMNLRSNRRTDLITKLSINENLSVLLHEFRRTLQERPTKCDCRGLRSTESYPQDCFEIQSLGFNISGIYKIKPDYFEAFYVLCDMSSAGGGWTVFQNRFDGFQDFYKPWMEYKHGFGNLAGEFWLGLEKMHFLSNQKLYELRVEMESHSGSEAYASYTVFSIGSEVEGYRISTIGSYSGNAGDSLSYHSGQKFTTYDADNDEWKEGICAIEHGGAWWYRECDKSNLNGRYMDTPSFKKAHGIYWNTFKGPTNFLSRTKMMIRPLPISQATNSPQGTVSATVTKTSYNDLTRKSGKQGKYVKKSQKQSNGIIPFIPLDEPVDDEETR